MNQLLFGAWVAAGVILVFPLGMLFRLGCRLAGRERARLSAVPAGVAFPPEDTAASLSSGDSEGAEPTVPAAAPEKGATRAAPNLAHRLAPVFSFLVYVAFIAGAIYYIPQILSWVLDTPHPMAAVSSQSMWPTLRKGDLIFLQGVDKPEDLQVGDIIAFEHEKGITVHRVVEIDGDLITTKGDANPINDKPIRFDWVVGRALTIGGRLARVPYVGSIAELFGPLASQAGQSPEEQQPSAGESTGSLATPGAGTSQGGQTGPRPEESRSGDEAGNAFPGTNELVSVDSAGNQANAPSTSPAISGDGRYVAFVSAASNLAPGDTNDQSDVFVHDRQTGATERVSEDSAGGQADGGSEAPAISGDGRYVAFVSAASNLVRGDTNGDNDVFVHDRKTGATERVSEDSAGGQADGGSEAPAISSDGRHVAFVSAASNLVRGDTNGESDVFVHDRQTGATERVSVDSAGGQANGRSDALAISADGRFVAFASLASNLAAGDTSGQGDIFVHDRWTGSTERASVDGSGNQADGNSDRPAISGDGRLVAFESSARNLVPDDTNRRGDVFVHDRETGATERVSVNSAGSQTNSGGSKPAISGDGRIVAFQAGQGNLVPGDTNRFLDVFVHDRRTGGTERVSVNNAGDQGSDHSGSPTLSGDGRLVGFWSWATNLVRVEAKQQIVVVRDRHTIDANGP